MNKIILILLLSILSLAFAQSENPDGSSITALANDEDFTTLVSLLEQADLLETLEAGIYTIFAPNNRVFENFDEDILASLQTDPEALKSVLLSHVVEGAYSINDLQDAEEGTIVSLQGEPLEFNVTLVGFRVNGADFASGNVENTYSNGLIHGVHDLVIPLSMKDTDTSN